MDSGFFAQCVDSSCLFQFVPWKKRYFRLKKSHPQTLCEMSGIMQEHNMTFPHNFLPGLIR